jgi:hypothetical protein
LPVNAVVVCGLAHLFLVQYDRREGDKGEGKRKRYTPGAETVYTPVDPAELHWDQREHSDEDSEL